MQNKCFSIGDLHDDVVLLQLPECFGNFLSYSDFYSQNSKTIGPNYLTKENGQSILVLVVYDAIMQVVAYSVMLASFITTAKALFVQKYLSVSSVVYSVTCGLVRQRSWVRFPICRHLSKIFFLHKKVGKTKKTVSN